MSGNFPNSDKTTDPIRETDADARALASDLITQVRTASLGVIDPVDGSPMVTRVALVRLSAGPLVSLISTLSYHTQALRTDPRCSLLISAPSTKGDPLNEPRLTLKAKAIETEKDKAREDYLSLYPKAKLYFDFGDFQMFHFKVTQGLLNGGFGKAYRLEAVDLGIQ